MIIENWKYSAELESQVDYDKHYSFHNGKMIDIGWNEIVSDVHSWITYLNKVSGRLFKKTRISPNKIKMNESTSKLIWLKHNTYYCEEEGRLARYEVEISNDIEDNKINVCLNNDIKGQINIIR